MAHGLVLKCEKAEKQRGCQERRAREEQKKAKCYNHQSKVGICKNFADAKKFTFWAKQVNCHQIGGRDSDVKWHLSWLVWFSAFACGRFHNHLKVINPRVKMVSQRIPLSLLIEKIPTPMICFLWLQCLLLILLNRLSSLKQINKDLG